MLKGVTRIGVLYVQVGRKEPAAPVIPEHVLHLEKDGQQRQSSG